MRSGEKMAEWHYMYVIPHDTWWPQVVVTGMEVASVSSRRERLDIQNMIRGCYFLADSMNRSICRCTPFKIWENLFPLMQKSNFCTLKTSLSLHHFLHFLFIFAVLKKEEERLSASKVWVCHHSRLLCLEAARTSGWEHFNEVDEANLKDIIDFYWFFDGPKSWFLYIFCS